MKLLFDVALTFAVLSIIGGILVKEPWLVVGGVVVGVVWNIAVPHRK